MCHLVTYWRLKQSEKKFNFGGGVVGGERQRVDIVAGKRWLSVRGSNY